MDNKSPDLLLESGLCFIQDCPGRDVAIQLITGYQTGYGVGVEVPEPETRYDSIRQPC